MPGEIELDALLPENMRIDPDEDRTSNEKLSHYATWHEALDLPAQDIPLIYLLATPSEWPTLGVPAYDDVILAVIDAADTPEIEHE